MYHWKSPVLGLVGGGNEERGFSPRSRVKAVSLRSPVIPNDRVPSPPNPFDILPIEEGSEDEETAASDTESIRSEGTDPPTHSSKPHKGKKVAQTEKAR